MKTKADISRRDLIKLTAGATGAMAFAGMVPGIMTPNALAQAAQKSAVVIVFMKGGYNALFSSADSFSAAGAFGVNNGNMLNLGNGLVVDSSFGILSDFAKSNMAAVGIAHGISDHDSARADQLTVDKMNPVIALASAMGGAGAIKAANIGNDEIDGPKAAINGTSLQVIRDMRSTIDALGGGIPDPTMPKRDLAAKGLAAAQAMSAARLKGNPGSLVSMENGYKAAIETLVKPAQVFNAQEMMTAYGLNGTAITNDMRSKFAGAELMIKAGANVVTVTSNDWDSHGDRDGSGVRRKFTQEIMPGLKTFTDRMVSAQSNVTVVILGDFARSLPGSDHASVSVATVIGPNVKVGTTGKVDARVGLPGGTPNSKGFWGLIAALAQAPAAVQMFGGNMHQTISKV